MGAEGQGRRETEVLARARDGESEAEWRTGSGTANDEAEEVWVEWLKGGSGARGEATPDSEDGSTLQLAESGSWRCGSKSSMLSERWRGTELDAAAAEDEARQGVEPRSSDTLEATGDSGREDVAAVAARGKEDIESSTGRLPGERRRREAWRMRLEKEREELLTWQPVSGPACCSYCSPPSSMARHWSSAVAAADRRCS